MALPLRLWAGKNRLRRESSRRQNKIVRLSGSKPYRSRHAFRAIDGDQSSGVKLVTAGLTVMTIDMEIGSMDCLWGVVAIGGCADDGPWSCSRTRLF
jgi:hypothetical protein